MKKILTAAIFALIGCTQTHAQVTFKPGLRAGANFSHFTKGSDYDNYDNYYNSNDNRIKFESKTDFYVGFYGALRLTKYYTLQPEINYSRQGSKFSTRNFNYDQYGNSIGSSTMSGQIDVSYLSISVINKFTFSEKFNVHVGPTIDFVVDRNGAFVTPNNNSYYYYDSDPTDVDLAFVAGVGFNFTKNIGIEARVKKGIIPVIDTYDDNHTNVNFSVGATYTFDIK